MRILLLAILAVTLFAACSDKSKEDGGERETSSDETPEPREDPQPSPGPSSTLAPTSPATACTAFPEGILPGETALRTLVSGEREREYLVHVPAGAEVDKELPVVLNFHGLGSNAPEQELYSGLVPISDARGFLLVTPNGTGSPRGWAAFSFLPTGTNDLQFTRDLLDELDHAFCIDEERVYSTGLSNGAYMSSRLACVMGDRIAAIAPVAGVYYPTEPCGDPVPVLAFHGTADAVVPFLGGQVLGILPYAGAPASIALWQDHNGCEAQETTQITEHVRRIDGSGCEAEASLVVVEGDGHTWPGSFPVPRLGPTTKEISAAEMIWEFFEDKRLGE